jgi:copper homeostasis protein
MKQPSHTYLLEVCVDSAESAIAAQVGGARRVELCDNLMEGGTTPSAGAIALARQHLHIALNVIIRPRGGDFDYSALEYEIMRRDIEVAKQLGADGVVIGLLKPNGTVDKKRTQALIDLARPMSVTFHRAFDMTRDPFAALETLIELGADRILTTGQEATVVEGLELVAELVRRARDRIIIMPGGANERSVARVLGTTGAREFHLTAFSPVESAMHYRNPRPFMGGELRPPEYSRNVTDPRRVRQILRAARQNSKF